MPPFSFAPRHQRSCLAISKSIALLLLSAALGFAKEPPVNAIVLYDTAKGPAYVQITDLLINGKAELRSCTTGQKIDKSGYGRLAKVTLTGATSLERTADGLILTKASGSSCVVPANLKFDKDISYTPFGLADKAVLQGKTAGGGDQNLPEFKTGVKVVFVAAPDVEFAEYLLAQRAATIAGWEEYLDKYGNSSHASTAKQSLASLLAQDGEHHFATYKQSVTSANLAFADLSAAKMRVGQSIKLVPNHAPTSKLQDEVTAELAALNGQAQNELAAYKGALSAHKPGYRHLTAAKILAGHILEIDPSLEAGLASDKLISEEVQKLENSLHTADTLVITVVGD